jgi:hypothetical protein
MREPGGNIGSALDRRLMHALAEGRAAILDHAAAELAHMRVAHRRGDAAIGDDAGEIEVLDAAFAQAPFEPRRMEGRKGDLLDRDVGGRERVDHLLPPASGHEIALAQERAQ